MGVKKIFPTSTTTASLSLNLLFSSWLLPAISRFFAQGFISKKL